MPGSCKRMVTQRAYIVGGVGFCFYLINIVNSLPTVFYALTWLTVSILVCSFGIALLSLMGLDCCWQTVGARVTESLGKTGTATDADDRADAAPMAGGPTVQVQLANSGTLNKTGILLEILLEDNNRAITVSRRFLVEALPSGGSLTSAIPLTDLPRGKYRIKHIRLIGSDVLGLFRVQRIVGAGETQGQNDKDGTSTPSGIIVGPATVGLQTGNTAVEGSGAQGEGAAVRYLGNSEELRGTRPYVAGDDLRRVHWKSTARLGGLVVKEFHRTTRAQSVVVWDGVAEATEDAVEFSLRLASSLCRVFTEKGRPCTLLRLDAQPLSVATGGQSNTSGGALFLGRVTEALAEAQANRSGALAEALKGYLASIPTGSDVFVVSPCAEIDVREVSLLCLTRNARVNIATIDQAESHAIIGAAMARLHLSGKKSMLNGAAMNGTANGHVAEDVTMMGRLTPLFITPATAGSPLTLRDGLRRLLEGVELPAAIEVPPVVVETAR